jgi:class 3 adenylate cyclase/tetratricopeptide (TPR) repeat protein
VSEEGVVRRLAAILAADVVGYSRLMGEDEAGTLERLKSLRRELVQPKIAEGRGRIVKLMGDGLLAEFPSVVEAVQCAVDIQQDMASREADLPDDRRVRLRVGVNLGDIIVEGSDIYGDGVNVAARLEGLAEPGGICVSRTVFNHVKGKVDTTFEDLGEKEVKNIAEPVRVYRPCCPSPTCRATPSRSISPTALPRTSSRNCHGSKTCSSSPATQPLPSRAKPWTWARLVQSLASAIWSRVACARRGTGCASRPSSLRPKPAITCGPSVTTATHEIAVAVPGQLDVAAVQRARRRPVENLTAYDYVLRGEWLRYQDFGAREPLALFEKAIEIDPQCARAYDQLAGYHAYSVFAHGAAIDESAQLARSLAEKALEIDPADPAIQATVAHVYIMVGEHDLARRHIEKAIKLNPNDYHVIMYAALVLAYLGDHGEGLNWIRMLLRHDPNVGKAVQEIIFDVYYMARRYEDAIESIKGWGHPPPHVLAEMSAAYAQADRMDDARATLAMYKKTWPADDTGATFVHAHVRMCARPEDRDHWLEGYRKAGIEV